MVKTIANITSKNVTASFGTLLRGGDFQYCDTKYRRFQYYYI